MQTMATADKKGTQILARTFFNQLRAGGYTQNQVIDIASELLDLVAGDLRDGDRATKERAVDPEVRPSA